MNRRITRGVTALAGLLVAIVCQLALAGNAAGIRTGVEELRAGPWYTPQERQALIAYANASFAERRRILAGAGTP
jgi:hypothetical protein